MSFKEEFQKAARILNWDPSDYQLNSIRNDIARIIKGGKKITAGHCQGIASKHCPDTLFAIREGIDNSDLNTMLALAMRKK